ncbi:hypothetical protein [Sulfitobacter sp. JB4-11]|uniref:hypothetical protein n=1 Tax=Sulfitobacter rhodophyticola TaxID=3238304 RepID=UPI0035144791
MLIVTHDTIRNPAILRVRQLPRKFFGRVTVWPKGPVGLRRMLRIMVEFQALRYTIALLPLVAVGFTWTGLALPLAQAPLFMLIILWWVEMRVLRTSPARRARMMDAAEAERGLDVLAVQARAILTRIAAGRDMRAGLLHLVIEQSELGLFAPLTYVSVQTDAGPEVVALTKAEREIIHSQLFQPPLTEQHLHRINTAQNTFLRDITLEARSVSAHARLAAALA